MLHNQKGIEQLTSTIEQLKENQEIYNYKLQQINQTRSKIQDQLLLLSRDYEKKIKDLQTKLEKTVTQNQQLHRQNQLFKRDIQGFENRLMEKEKLISVLILQQNSVVAHSQKSRSENNDENRNQFFNDEDKGFKKQQKPKILPASLQSNYQPENKFYKKPQKVESPIQSKLKKPEDEEIKIQSIESDNEEQKQPQVPQRKPVPMPPSKMPKNRNAPPPRTKKPVIKEKQPTYIEEQQKETIVQDEKLEQKLEQEEEVKEVNNMEIISQIKRKDEEVDEDKNDFFDNLKENSPKYDEKQINSDDFFTQLGSNQEENNPMNEIQESSIDYADNSMMSSTTTNMLQNQNLTAPPPKKMKKKAKREKITSVDPNEFD